MLFPVEPERRLVGIARMAAESDPLEQKRRVEYREIEARSIISRCQAGRMPFRWTINPYRGCEFGCKYCYARYAHEYMEMTPASFEERIFAKRFSVASFRRELGRIPRKDSIAIGTATDPYQPAERRYGLTRKILEALAEERGRKLGLTTKSDLVARDSELLERIAKGNVLFVFLTVTSMDRDLARLTEPGAPRPDLRIEAVRKLAAEGIKVGVLAAPILPGLTDSEESLDRVGAAAAEAGASSFGGRVVFLRPCARTVFFPFLKERFPELCQQYLRLFERGDYLRGAYPDEIAGRVQAVRTRHELRASIGEYEPELWQGEPQLSLFPNQ